MLLRINLEQTIESVRDDAVTSGNRLETFTMDMDAFIGFTRARIENLGSTAKAHTEQIDSLSKTCKSHEARLTKHAADIKHCDAQFVVFESKLSELKTNTRPHEHAPA